VFENRVLRRIFGPKRDEVTGESRKLHNEELHILYLSTNIIRQIKSRRMRWAGHEIHMREEIKCTVFWWGGLKERDHLEDQGIYGRMGSEWILGRLAGRCRVDPVGSEYGLVAGSCKYSDEPSGSGTMELAVNTQFQIPKIISLPSQLSISRLSLGFSLLAS
jgi:hypothetical protein